MPVITTTFWGRVPTMIDVRPSALMMSKILTASDEFEIAKVGVIVQVRRKPLCGA
jgi:hypothetical protein